MRRFPRPACLHTAISFSEGWDVHGADLKSAAVAHGVIGGADLDRVGGALERVKPWRAVSSTRHCRNIDGENRVNAASHRQAIEVISQDLRRFRDTNSLDQIVMLNLASTESDSDYSADIFQSVEAFERALDEDDEAIGPAMLYAYAAIKAGVPYGNFTPSVAADVPALRDLATQSNVPIAGKDGKTGQTMLKTVIAPALKSRALHVDGWFSTNILGNRDGLALDDPGSLRSKLKTKGSVLDQMLGYPVEDHIVHIHYYRPRGDDKEAWDNIDVTGFMGQKMQIKVNFLCKDSILAAPLAIEIARVLGLAQHRGEGGVQEQLGLFFKAPMVRNGHAPEHALHKQEQVLLNWLTAR